MGRKYTAGLEFGFFLRNRTRSSLTRAECTPSLSNQEQLPVWLNESIRFSVPKNRLDVPGCGVVSGKVEIEAVVSSSQSHSGGHSGLEQSHLWSSVVESTTVVASTFSAVSWQLHSAGQFDFEQSQSGSVVIMLSISVVPDGNS